MDTAELDLTMPEHIALSVLSSAIATGQCACGGTWTMEMSETGLMCPNMDHDGDCPAVSRTGQNAVHKVLRNIIYKAIASDRNREDD